MKSLNWSFCYTVQFQLSRWFYKVATLFSFLLHKRIIDVQKNHSESWLNRIVMHNHGCYTERLLYIRIIQNHSCYTERLLYKRIMVVQKNHTESSLLYKAVATVSTCCCQTSLAFLYCQAFPFPSMWERTSMGKGKMMVEFFSAEICCRVWRYRS